MTVAAPNGAEAKRLARRRRLIWRRTHIWYPLEYALVWTLVACGRLLPIDWVSAVGGGVGRLAARVAKEQTAAVCIRLQALGWSAEAARAGAIRHWVDLGRTILEYAVVDRLWQSGRIRVDWHPALVEHLRAGRPMIFVSGHFSNWEATLVTAAGLGFRTAAFYRPQRNPHIDRLLQRIRLRSVNRLLVKGQRGLRDAVAHLRGGGAIGILVDERSANAVATPARAGAVGIPLRVTARLAKAGGATLLPLRLTRTGRARFVLKTGEPLVIAPDADEDAELAAAARLDRWIAAEIRSDPVGWAWLGRVDDLVERLDDGMMSRR